MDTFNALFLQSHFQFRQLIQKKKNQFFEVTVLYKMFCFWPFTRTRQFLCFFFFLFFFFVLFWCVRLASPLVTCVQTPRISSYVVFRRKKKYETSARRLHHWQQAKFQSLHKYHEQESKSENETQERNA